MAFSETIRCNDETQWPCLQIWTLVPSYYAVISSVRNWVVKTIISRIPQFKTLQLQMPWFYEHLPPDHSIEIDTSGICQSVSLSVSRFFRSLPRLDYIVTIVSKSEGGLIFNLLMASGVSTIYYVHKTYYVICHKQTTNNGIIQVSGHQRFAKSASECRCWLWNAHIVKKTGWNVKGVCFAGLWT